MVNSTKLDSYNASFLSYVTDALTLPINVFSFFIILYCLASNWKAFLHIFQHIEVISSDNSISWPSLMHFRYCKA